ncbi:hypothetical protein [Campylobacter jejuni]|nr:hypothetical protein [Campylobacter jejuni]
MILFSEDMIENLCTNKIKLFSDIKDYTESVRGILKRTCNYP